FYVAGNLFDAVMDTAGNVAVIAHLAGFGAGFGAGLLLLTRGAVDRDDYDFLSWVSGRKKKQLMARFGRGASNAAPLPPPPGLGMAHGAGRVPSARELQAELRGHLASGDVRNALDAYQRFHQAYPRLALGEELQIDVANALFRAGQQVQAAEAFERFARYYPAHPQASDALYSAGMLHARRTGKLDHGRRLLEAAAAVLTDREKVKRAREMVGRLGSAAAARRVRLDGK
ncbi:outer membrane protein assembly factor BamD, partial [bacterium]|nr:outer membrane protein assembly factor BamD [bacterium]